MSHRPRISSFTLTLLFAATAMAEPPSAEPILYTELATDLASEKPKVEEVTGDPVTRGEKLQFTAPLQDAAGYLRPDGKLRIYQWSDVQEYGPKPAATSADNCMNVKVSIKARATPAPTSTSTAPVAPIPPIAEVPQIVQVPDGMQSLAATAAVANETAPLELLQTADKTREAFRDAARSDDSLLANYYQELPLSTLGSYLTRAKSELDQKIETLNQAGASDDSGEVARFRNLYMNARDKAEAAAQLVEEDVKNQAVPLPFGAIGQELSPAAALARTAALAQLFGAEGKLPSPQDALANRVLLLSGLPAKEQAKALKRLKLAEPLKVRIPGRAPASVTVLHNGYIWGGGKTGVDCSSFVSSLLPGNETGARYTTFDFAAMWYYLVTGAVPKPPFSFMKGREAAILKAATAFSAVNLYQGDSLMVGDLLIYRIPYVPMGHVFVIRAYDSQTKIARVIEAAQSKGGIAERNFPLSLAPPTAARRRIRPGLLGLRLKQKDNAVCRFRDGPRKKGGPS